MNALAHMHPQAVWTWAGLIALTAAAAPPLAQVLIGIGLTTTVALASEPVAALQFRRMLGFAAALVTFRLVLQVLLGADSGAVGLVLVPRIELPLGIHLGGAITSAAVGLALRDGLAIACVVLALSAAAALCPPVRLVQTFPAALNSVALFFGVALSYLPLLAEDAGRLRAAARWRGERTNWRWLLKQAVPLAESALQRSLQLGAALALRRPASRLTAASGWLLLLALAGFAGGLMLAVTGQSAEAVAAASVAAGVLCIELWRRGIGVGSFNWQYRDAGLLVLALALWLTMRLQPSVSSVAAVLIALLPLLFAERRLEYA